MNQGAAVTNTWSKTVRGLVFAIALLAAAILGLRASRLWLILLFAGSGALALVLRPQLGPIGLIAAALVLNLEFSTGTEVQLNPATLLVPMLGMIWIVDTVLRRRDLRWATARANRPLALFLLTGLLSLLLGNVLWDPAIPKSGNFWLVQFAQWAIFVFAALAFWLMANLRDSAIWLPRVAWAFLILGGCLAILWLLPGIGSAVRRFTTVTLIRAPFWTLLTALSAGQLFFNRDLKHGQQLFLVGLLVAALVYALVEQRKAVSNWVGIAAVLGTLVWLRAPKLRGPIVVMVVILALSGILFTGLYEFAGGEDEWLSTGGSRLVLIARVVEVTLRNPITGLGPASYRLYAGAEPLRYQRALWIHPRVNSHNNYVDLFAHTGLLGLGLFLWFSVELSKLGWRLSTYHREGFIAGYANGMLAAWVGSLVLMMLADWILPFVYNIGFGGFQASLLVWLFLGGLVAVDHMDRTEQ